MSNSKVHKFFTLAKFRNVTNWSVSHILGMNVGFNEKYPMVMIGDIITRSAETVNIEDDKDYRQVTLKTNGGGAVQRKDGIKKGKEIGTKKQYVVHTDQFIMSKIDARNGAFGVIGSDLEGSIVTADFPVFDVDKNKVLPEYLKLISSTSRFVEFAKSCSSGTTNRQRIDVKQFLLQQIPLPSLKEQEKILSSYWKKKNLSKGLGQRIDQINKKIEQYLFEIIGVSLQTGIEEDVVSPFRFLKKRRFKNIHEWGTKAIRNEGAVLHSFLYPNIPLHNILEINPKTAFSQIKNNQNISFIPMECISDEYGEWVEKRFCGVDASKGYTKFRNGDLLWAKITPCMENGKSAVVDNLENDYGCGSTEFHVLRNNNENLNIHYVHALLRTRRVLENAKKSFTGSAGQQRVPKSYLDNLCIPVPPIGVQNMIVEIIQRQKRIIKEIKQKMKSLNTLALTGFETEVFK